jgi:hypothetical protein
VSAHVSSSAATLAPVKFVPDSSVGVGQSAVLQWTGKNPVTILAELGSLLPHLEPFKKLWCDGEVMFP